jgi:hypothetical protein
MGVDYGWEKPFSSIHYAVTSTERAFSNVCR